jgi:Ca2+-binding EF-hand superfamily protein
MQDGSSSTSATASNATSTNPISQAFSSLDTNSDGTLSQSELETAIENAGGTASEADAVYSALGGTSTNGISESSFAKAAQAGGPPPPPDGGTGGHYHHHYGDNSSSSQSASNEAAQIFSSLGISQNGSISEGELASALDAMSSTGSSATTTTSANN